MVIHEIRRQLLLGSKAMTNLDSVLKSKDTTLLTKVHIVKKKKKVQIVKAMVFPVATNSCETWTIKKSECQKLMLSNCGAVENSRDCLG